MLVCIKNWCRYENTGCSIESTNGDVKQYYLSLSKVILLIFE